MYGILKKPAGLLGTLCLLILLMPTAGFCGDVPEVRVSNFPETQQIHGVVSIEGTAKAVKKEGILLSQSRRNEINELYHAGKIETEGYTSLSVHLQGEIKSTTFPSGSIGIILVPDEEPVLRAFKESKQIQFPIEAACAIKSGDSEYFSCEQSNQNIGFPRYRVYFYNTLTKSAEVNAYLYVRK